MEKKSKEVKMQLAKKKADEKLSYEQLEQLAANLRQEAKHWYQQCIEMKKVLDEFNEVNMLLDILGKSEHFSEKFATRCSEKIESIITVALDNSEKAEEKES